MSNLVHLRFLIPLILAAAAGASVTVDSATAKRRNVLLIVVDDLRASALGCFTSDDDPAVTPNTDALAEVSTVYTNAFAQQALCAPSRNSFLTSRRPDTTRLYDFYSYWRNEAGNFTTLPQYFKEKGYETYGIGKVFHPGISSNFSDDMPYSWSRTPFHPSTQKYKEWPVCGGGKRNLLCPVDLSTQPEGTLPDLQSSAEAARFLTSRQRRADYSSSPFFLAVGFHKPHVPFKFPKKYLELFPLEKIPMPSNPSKPALMPDIAWAPFRALRERDDIASLHLPFPYGPMPDNYTRLIRQHYYAATSYVDDQIGLVLEALRESGEASSTVVALLGDHGWSLGEHQEFAKYGNFDVDVRVPLIVHDPSAGARNLTSFRRTDILKSSQSLALSLSSNVENKEPSPVELLDLFPTLADLAGLPPVPLCPKDSQKRDHVMLCTEGKSLAGNNLWKDSTLAFSQYPRPSVEPRKDSDKPRKKHIRYMGYTVRTPRFRYTRWAPFDPKRRMVDWKGTVAEELYDHQVDLLEDHNKASSFLYWDVRRRLRRILKRKVAGVNMESENSSFPLPAAALDWFLGLAREVSIKISG